MEASQPGTTGRLLAGIEAKIVNTETGEAMSPGEQGELWLRGPLIMKGMNVHEINARVLICVVIIIIVGGENMCKELELVNTMHNGTLPLFVVRF